MKKLLAALLAVMMILSTVSFAAPTMVSTVENADEAVQNTADDAADVAELADEIDWTDDAYGDLLYLIDFEGIEKYETSTSISKHGKVNPNYDSTGWISEVSSAASLALATSEDGNTYLTFTNSTSKWPQFQTRTSGANFAEENGIYTVVADVMYGNSGEAGGKTNNFYVNARYQYYLEGDETAHRNDKNGSQVTSGKIDTANSTGSWYGGSWTTSVGTWNKTKVNPEGSTVDGIYNFLHVFEYDSVPTVTKKDTFAIDNIKLYWKPFDVDVTILGGENTVAGDKTYSYPLTAGAATTVTKADLMAAVIDHGDMILADLTLEDGSAFESLTLTEDVTLKAVWKKYTYDDTISLNFNSEEETAQLTWMSKGNVDSNPVSSETEGAVLGSGYSTAHAIVHNGTYATVEYKIVDPNGEEVDTGLYDSNWTITKANGNSCKMPISNIGAIQMRVRARNAKTEKASYVYRNSAAANVSATYNPTFALDLFFALDIGDGTTFTPLHGKRQLKYFPATSYTTLGEEWFTVYCDLTTLSGAVYDPATKTWSATETTEYWNDANFLRTLRIDPSDHVWAGTEYDIDYIHFIQKEEVERIDAEAYFLNDGVKTPIIGGMSDIDYRYNSVLCYDFEEDLGLTADEFYALLVEAGMTNDIYNAAAEYDAENYVYTLYAGSSLLGKSVTLPYFAVDGVDVACAANGAVLKFAAKKAFHDGENLIPNGEFTVPYYNSFKTVHNVFDMTLDNDNNRVEVTFLKSGANGYNTVRNEAIQFEAGKRYYVDASFKFVGFKGEDGTIDDSIKGRAGMNFWMPKDHSRYALSNKTFWGGAAEYPYFEEGVLDAANVMNYSNFDMHTSKTSQTRTRILNLFEVEDTNSYISFQSDILRGAALGEKLVWKVEEDGTETVLARVADEMSGSNKVFVSGQETAVNGLTYYIEKLVVKEMFDVNFVDADGKAIETRYAVKNMGIYLPEANVLADGRTVTSWTDGENTYAPGALYTLTEAGTVTMTAVTSGVVLTPATSDEVSVRLVNPVGVRFKASVTTEQKAASDEYGFIVARKTALEAASIASNDFTFASDVKKVSGSAYVKGGVDKIFASDASNIFFTAVLYNIPESAYEDVMVARPYVKKDGVVVYGEAVEKSLYDAACAVKETIYDELDENSKTVVDGIIAKVDTAVEA